jgi:ADP-dependent NAD(P)H-hydrate dehydratase / NAD(P)H-hydrate epimerase
MELITTNQSQALDRLSIEKFGLSTYKLMKNAGKAITKKSIGLLKEIKNPFVLVFAGNGNNGIDALITAKNLHDIGYNVKIMTTSVKEREGLYLKFYQKCIDSNIEILLEPRINEIKTPNLIIDGILGTGFKRKIRKELIGIIEWINESKSIVLSIDVPSGLNTDSGLVENIAINADYTVTIEKLKVGMVFRQGKRQSGTIKIAKVGFPEKAKLFLGGLNWGIYNEDTAFRLLTKPKVDINKYNSGKVLIIAGSKGMTGASILATHGALRTGAGMTISVVPSSLNNIFENCILEGITYSLNDYSSGYLKFEHFDKIMDKISWADCVLIGPGLGRNESTLKLIKKLIFSIKKPLILDADGLFPFKNNYKKLNERKFPLVITPHFGELSSITGIETKKIESDFPEIMTRIMKGFNHTALVKQVPSCTFNEKNVTINNSGNPGLAKAGSGDILSGMIASFVSQGIPIDESAKLAAFIHGKSSDLISIEKGFRGQNPSDLLDIIPRVIMNYENI